MLTASLSILIVLKLEKIEFKDGNNLTAATRKIEREDTVLVMLPLIKTEYIKLDVTIRTSKNSIKYLGTIEYR